MLRALPFVLGFAFTLFCLIDVITARPHEVRHLPKPLWVFVIVLAAPLGGIAWFIVGRPRSGVGGGGGRAVTVPRRGGPTGFPPDDLRAIAPESTEEFRRRVRQRAQAQRARAAEQAQRDAGTDDERPAGPDHGREDGNGPQ